MVISIVSFLSSTVMANLNTARAKARDASRLQSMRELQTALNLYYHDNGSYPTCGAGNQNGICGGAGGGGNLDAAQAIFSNALSPLVPNNITSIPKDPINAKNLGYEYMVRNNTATWASCDGILIYNNYDYVLTFRTEKVYFNLPQFGQWGGSSFVPFNKSNGGGQRGSALNEYCILPN